jgi:hypothetical protein
VNPLHPPSPQNHPPPTPLTPPWHALGGEGFTPSSPSSPPTPLLIPFLLKIMNIGVKGVKGGEGGEVQSCRTFHKEHCIKSESRICRVHPLHPFTPFHPLHPLHPLSGQGVRTDLPRSDGSSRRRRARYAHDEVGLDPLIRPHPPPRLAAQRAFHARTPRITLSPRVGCRLCAGRGTRSSARSVKVGLASRSGSARILMGPAHGSVRAATAGSRGAACG